MSTPIVLEFGSHSLKVHYRSRTSGIFRKRRLGWRLGHEVYAEGRISAETTVRAVRVIQALREAGVQPQSVAAIATGALRDARNGKQFLEILERKLEIKVRVISGREEATLLAKGYLIGAKSPSFPALITDIGGGSLEIVQLGRDQTVLRDSLPLGAVRLFHLGTTEGKGFDEGIVSEWIDECFDEALLVDADEIHCTGGTAKAIGRLCGKKTVSREELAGLVETVRRRGPPGELADDRKLVFYPGLLVLERLMRHAGATRLSHLSVPVGRIFLQEVARRFPASTPATARKDYVVKNLRITRIIPAGNLSRSNTAGPRSGPPQERGP